jgi:hypothetical protein
MRNGSDQKLKKALRKKIWEYIYLFY